MTNTLKDEWAHKQISDDEFNDWLCKAVSRVVDNTEKIQSIEPKLLILEMKILTGENPLSIGIITGNDWNDFRTRQKAVYACGVESYRAGLHPIAIFLITEAWMKSLSKEESAQREGRAVSDYPDKKEILMVTGLTLDKRTGFCSIEIQRDKDDFIKLGELTMIPSGSNASFTTEHSILENFFIGYGAAYKNVTD